MSTLTHQLRSLTLYSTALFTGAALVTQFLLTLSTAILLRMFGISFRYDLFAIGFLSESSMGSIGQVSAFGEGPKWSEELIWFVYLTGPLVISAAGIFLAYILDRVPFANWKGRLALTWLAFLMSCSFPCGVLAGVFFYDGLGVAFQWISDSYAVRGMIALLVFLTLLFRGRIWQIRFLATAWSADRIDDTRNQKSYLQVVFVYPWIIGFFLLLAFNWPYSNLFWRAWLISTGYLALTLFDQRKNLIRLPYSGAEAARAPSTALLPGLFIALGIVILWIADFVLRS